MYNKTYRKTSFRVKRPIRGFRDLEVYQRTIAAAMSASWPSACRYCRRGELMFRRMGFMSYEICKDCRNDSGSKKCSDSVYHTMLLSKRGLAMFMEMFIPAVNNPAYNSENGACDSYCNKRAEKHLIFSFGMNEIRNSNIGYEERVYAKSETGRKFKKELAGKGSSNSDFCNVHQSFCQKFSSSCPDIHKEIVSYIIGFVKKENYYENYYV